MGFVETLSDHSLKGYLQGSGNYIYQVISTGDNGYHTYKCQAQSGDHSKVDFYVDGNYKFTLQNSGNSYSGNWFYFVGTTHRTSGGWSSSGQQIEILSRTVMMPLDRRAEAHVRSAVLRAFGITAISPTALTDAVFFLACGVRMVRAIAASYGHRPTAATTVHLLRRLVLEAGKLGAVDIASASLVQHLGGAVTERFATSAADALYAAYRMARLGIIVMDLCRPIPFREGEVPSVTSLVGNVVRPRSDPQVPVPPS